VQAIVLPIADRHLDYARAVRDRLRSAGSRVEVDERPESVGRKIRDAELRKIPYMLVVGDREQEAEQVSVRQHRGGDEGSEAIEAFVERLGQEVKTRAAG
jgi:threonyl-tRNA synthetase